MKRMAVLAVDPALQRFGAQRDAELDLHQPSGDADFFDQ
jgi:hypothetical protein